MTQWNLAAAKCDQRLVKGALPTVISCRWLRLAARTTMPVNEATVGNRKAKYRRQRNPMKNIAGRQRMKMATHRRINLQDFYCSRDYMLSTVGDAGLPQSRAQAAQLCASA